MSLGVMKITMLEWQRRLSVVVVLLIGGTFQNSHGWNSVVPYPSFHHYGRPTNINRHPPNDWFGGCCGRQGFFSLSMARKTSDSSNDAIETTSPTVTTTTAERTNHKSNNEDRILRRTLIATIENYVGSTQQGSEWKRLHNYIYRGTRCDDTKKLTVQQVHDVLAFLVTNVGDMELVRHIVQCTPRIFRRSVSTHLEPTLHFLQGLYSTELLHTALHRKPELLLTRGIGYTSKDDLELMQVYLSTELQMTPSEIAKLQRTTGSFVFQLPLYKVLSTVSYFRDLLTAGIQRASLSNQKDDDDDDPATVHQRITQTLKSLILKNPHVLQLSLESNIQPRIEFLQTRCQLEPTDVAHLLQSSSSATILGLSVQENLAPTLDYLEQVLSVDGNKDATVLSLKQCILAHSQILGLSLSNLHSKVSYLNAIRRSRQHDNQEEPNGDDKGATLASRVLKRAPSTVSLSLQDNLIPTIEFLARVWGVSSQVPTKEHFGGVHPADQSSEAMTPLLDTVAPTNQQPQESLAALLGEYPNILTLSLAQNLVPTVSFYNQTGYIALDDEWRPVQDHQTTTLLRGRYIASSLYQRLLPRWHFVQEKQEEEEERQRNDKDEQDDTEQQESLMDRLSLYILAVSSDKAFCKHIRLDNQEYGTYKRDAIPRLKFNNEVDSWLGSGRSSHVLSHTFMNE